MEKKRRFLFLLFFLVFSLNLFAEVYLNEIVSSNQTIIIDYYGEYGDWIELYNNSELDFDITDYFLTDDSDELNQWQFPAMIIPPHGFLLIWADNNDEVDPSGTLHTNFKIGSEETITLSSPDTLIVDSITLPALQSDYSFGRSTELSTDWYYFPQPTPNQANAGGYAGFLATPVASQPAGFYSTSFDLAFTNITDGAVLYYTLDGSEPVIAAPNTYVYTPNELMSLADL